MTPENGTTDTSGHFPDHIPSDFPTSGTPGRPGRRGRRPTPAIRFAVLTPDGHAIATSCNPELAAATALAVARHHRDHVATIIGPEGRRLEIDRFGAVTRPNSSSVGEDWQAVVEAVIRRLAPDGPAAKHNSDARLHRSPAA